jgi:hypothetical protein
VEEFALKEDKKRHLYPVFRYLLQIAYDAGTLLLLSMPPSLTPLSDLLSEDTLLLWADSRSADVGDAERRELFLEPVVQEFVAWLRDSVDESDDGDDEEEDDEEEED